MATLAAIMGNVLEFYDFRYVHMLTTRQVSVRTER
jgi:hypothetical protein